MEDRRTGEHKVTLVEEQCRQCRQCRLYIRKYSISRINEWNKLPIHYENANCVNTF